MMTLSLAEQAARARTRLGQALTKHVVDDFTVHGAEVIAKMRNEKPLDYVKLVHTILEKEDAGAAAIDAGYNVIERRIIEAGPRHG
jgi:hypothetical protein